MGRNRLVGRLAAAALVISALTFTGGPPARGLTGTYANPVSSPTIPQGVADPFVLRVGSTYHLYGTEEGGSHVPHFTSTDLKTWSAVNDALPTLGPWADPNGTTTWAPSVLERWFGSPYYTMYYTAHANATYNNRQCIGVAWSTNPAGPFVDNVHSGPLMCQLDRNGSIDPSVFTHPNQPGRNPPTTLFWKSEDNTLGRVTVVWNALLHGSGFDLVTAPLPVLTATTFNWEHGMIEAPAMTYDPGAKTYNLFYAGHWLLSNVQYGTGWARCVGGFGIFTSCTRAQPNQWMGSTAGVYAPASVEVFDEPAGNKWIVYHGFSSSQCSTTTGDCTGPRSLRVDKLCFQAGVPRTNGASTTSQSSTRDPSCLVDVP